MSLVILVVSRSLRQQYTCAGHLCSSLPYLVGRALLSFRISESAHSAALGLFCGRIRAFGQRVVQKLSGLTIAGCGFQQIVRCRRGDAGNWYEHDRHGLRHGTRDRLCSPYADIPRSLTPLVDLRPRFVDLKISSARLLRDCSCTAEMIDPAGIRVGIASNWVGLQLMDFLDSPAKGERPAGQSGVGFSPG